jgi:hypothetical protein
MIYNLLESVFGYPKSNASTQMQFNCPECTKLNYGIDDNKYNLEVNISLNNKGKYNKVCKCWKCGLSGPLFFIFKRYANKQQIEEFLKYENEPTIHSQIKKFKVFSLPKEFISFSNMDNNNTLHVEAYEYIKKRKVSKSIIYKDKLGFCIEGFYKDKIIIPSYDNNGKINYFISRSFKDNVEKNQAYKLPNADKKEIIFNEKNINWNGTVYIVEAYFEYTTIPVNTIILLGKSLYDNILSKLIKYKPNVVILLNPDAIDKRQNFNYNMTPNSSLEIQERLLSLGLTNVKIQMYNNNDDLNTNMQNYGKRYIFDLIKSNLKQ